MRETITYLTEPEIKEDSVIMIEFRDGSCVPYVVALKSEGAVTKSTKLVGRKLPDLIKDPSLYPIDVFALKCNQFFIGNEKQSGTDKRVAGYRSLTLEEKHQWLNEIESIPKLHDLFKILSGE